MAEGGAFAASHGGIASVRKLHLEAPCRSTQENSKGLSQERLYIWLTLSQKSASSLSPCTFPGLEEHQKHSPQNNEGTGQASHIPLQEFQHEANPIEIQGQPPQVEGKA